MTETVKQCSEVRAKNSFAFKVNGKGRTITVKAGDRFWVTNCQTDQSQSGFITVDRIGRGHISHGYAFTGAIWGVVRMNKAVGFIVAGMLALNIAVAARLTAAIPTYALTQTTASGDVYVLDSGLSAADCLEAVRPGLVCEVEAGQ